MYLHYDTETDGLNIPGQPSDHPDQPNIVSISAILDDAEGNTIHEFSTLIKPLRPIAAATTEIHGITTERAEAEGIPLIAAMAKIRDMVAQAETLVAFNHFFDFKLLKIACARLTQNFSDQGVEWELTGDSFRSLLESKTAICTMEQAAMHLIGKRRIKLSTAYFEMFKEEHSNAHTSQADTNASRRIFYEMKRRGVEMIPTSLAPRQYNAPLNAAQ